VLLILRGLIIDGLLHGLSIDVDVHAATATHSHVDARS
jgi:hypothetical protein